MRDPFCYSFRFCCDPGFNDKRELDALERFVREADIDDVAVFANVQELNTGHMTADEQAVWLTLMEAVERRLAPLGVTLSVNHWHSLMHADLGKTMGPEHPFRPMVDIHGRAASLCVCPLCESWQAHFTALCRRYAALHPHILWVEDDFRLHNHDPLTWGGCFCEAHMAEYARRAGEPELTREDFVAGVLRPGAPHPYRRIWLDVCRETMTALAERIGAAVRQDSEEAKVGLMSSVPYVHAAEGRDWKGILRGLAAGAAPVSRIHLPAYREMAAGEYLTRFDMVSMACRALLPPETEVYPELENYPYSLFSKSRAFTRFQFLSAMPLELKGMTIDLFDLNGGGIHFSEGYQHMLREVKPFLNRVTASGAMGQQRLGVRVMLCETSAYTLHTAAGRSMEELYPQEVLFAGLLGAMGIPFCYCTDPGVRGQTVAVSGQYFRNLTPREIEGLFEVNYVLLSGDALETLADMGLGHLAGVKGCRWLPQNSGAYTYEQAVEEETFLSMPGARASAAISSTDVLTVEYEGPVKCYTEFYDSFRQRACPGHAVVENRVLVYPFGRFAAPGDIPPMQLTALRREILQRALGRCGRLDAPMAVGTAHLHLYCTAGAGRLYVYLVNGGLDPLEELTLDMGPWRPAGAQVLCSDCTRRSLPLAWEGGRLALPVALAPLDAALITFYTVDMNAEEDA